MGLRRRVRHQLRSACTRFSMEIPVKKPINNLVVVSDLHVGDQLGLSSPAGCRLDNDGRYTPSKLQKIVWGYWKEFWDKWVPNVTKGEPYAIVINGDACEGQHHQSSTPITSNIPMQLEMAEGIISPLYDRCEGRLYMVRGTPAHVGESARDENALAKSVGAIADKYGQYARNDLWIRVGPGLVHLLHHIGTTSSSAHEASAINAELSAEYVEAARWSEKAPDVVVRSHRHRNFEIRLPNNRSYGIAFVTAGWQLRTPFAFKIAGARIAPPQFGGSLIRWDGEELYTRHKVWSVQRDTPE